MKCESWMTNEEMVAMLICNPERNSEIETQIATIVTCGPLDYIKLKSICVEQRILNQYASAVLSTSIGDVVPMKEKLWCKAFQARSEWEYKVFIQEIRKIQDLLENNRIRSVVFKGISYVPLVYKSGRLRQLGDIDMIVDSDNLIEAVNLLETIGYKSEGKNANWTQEMYEEELNWNVHISILEKDQFEVELHSATYYYTGYNLQDVLDRRVRNQDGIFVPCPEDVFVIACVHAWHHFPKRLPQIDKELVGIRGLLDVLLCDKMIHERNLVERAREIAQESNISEIVSFIVKYSYLQLSNEPQVALSNDLERKLVFWEVGNQSISALYRYFRSKETVKIMERWFADNAKPIKIFRTLPYSKERKYPFCLFPKIDQDVDGKWANNLLKIGDMDIPKMETLFDLSWNENGLLFEFISSPILIWKHSEQEAMEYYVSYFMVRYSKDRASEAKTLIIQKSDNNVFGYKREFVNEYYQKTTFCEEMIGNNLSSDEGSILLPWTLLEITNTATDKLFLDIQMRMVFSNCNGYVEVSWGSGNNGYLWNEEKNSSKLLNIIFEE